MRKVEQLPRIEQLSPLAVAIVDQPRVEPVDIGDFQVWKRRRMSLSAAIVGGGCRCKACHSPIISRKEQPMFHRHCTSPVWLRQHFNRELVPSWCYAGSAADLDERFAVTTAWASNLSVVHPSGHDRRPLTTSVATEGFVLGLPDFNLAAVCTEDPLARCVAR
jgi:hypothetical protein